MGGVRQGSRGGEMGTTILEQQFLKKLCYMKTEKKERNSIDRC